MKASIEARCTFRQQLDPLLSPLAQTACFLLNDEPAADDLVETTVQAAYRQYRGDLDDRTFRSWMYSCMVEGAAELCHTDSAGQSGQQGAAPRPLPSAVSDVPPADLSVLQRRLRAELQTEDIRQAISLIPYPIRTVLVLSLVANLSGREISRVLNSSPSIVKSQLHSGRRLLQFALYEQCSGQKPLKAAEPEWRRCD